MTTNPTPPPDPRDAIIAQLRRENRYLRSKVGDPPLGLQRVNTIGRILRRAYDDALSLLALRDANYTVTRALAVSLGISERRYYWATDFCAAPASCAKVSGSSPPMSPAR